MARKGEHTKVGRTVSGTAPQAAVATANAKPARMSWADLALAAGVHPAAVRKFAFR